VFIKKILIALTICGIHISTVSAPYNGDSFELEQPDGSTVPVLVWGDEYFQHVENLDGYTLVRNKETGWICYANLSDDSSELVPTDSIYRFSSSLKKSLSGNTDSSEQPKHLNISREHRLKYHEQIRSSLQEHSTDATTVPLPSPAPQPDEDLGTIMSLQGVTPTTGNFTGLTILIDFSDKTATIPVDSIENFVNKQNYTGYGNNGSVRDYFYDVSGGKVDYKNILFGYYRAKQPKTYYDNSNSSFGTKAQELITEALNNLKTKNFDFSQLSADSRKRIYAVNVLYAGSPAMGWSEGLWPHQGTISSFSANGYYVNKYQMSNIGTSLNIGTFCHENGHLLFKWPDLYDYGGESAGVGNFCIMCGTNAKNPARPCAYLRDYSGWDVVTDITDIVSGTIFSTIPNTNTSFMFRNKSNSSEMFYIEGARRTGRNKTIPDSGLMIWHVDRKGSNNSEQRTSSSHYLVSLEQADNLYELELGKNNGDKGDLFRAGAKNRFDDLTTPAATWWNASKSGMQIWNISKVADTMSFSIGDTVSGTRYDVNVTASEHGTINPSGVIQVIAGQSVRFIIKPDSGYQIDLITINGTNTTIRDTVTIDKISSDQTIHVDFGVKSSLVCTSPREDDQYFVGDTMLISWQKRGVTVQGISLSYSLNSGKDFTTITDAVSANDSIYKWRIAELESDNCCVRIAERDGTPSVISGFFSIHKKPQLSIAEQTITLAVGKGKSITKEISIKNIGTGNLTTSATSIRQIKKVLINELSVGSDSQAPDAVEVWNSGVDIDVSGWQLIWEDNKETSGSYTFPKGYVFKAGSAISMNDVQTDTTANSLYLGQNVQWLFNDFLEMSVSLTDQSGHGVDFVKTKGSPVSPPEGTVWSGDGMVLCSSFVYRSQYYDTDSSKDWGCGAKGTLKQVNSTQQKTAPLPFLTILPLIKSVSQNGSFSSTITVDATNLDIGTISDTIVIYHNDPSRPSPLKIPCQITVYNPLSVKNDLPREPLPLKTADRVAAIEIAPNPAEAGQRVSIRYTPEGNERYGDLLIFSSMGNCLFHEPITFSDKYNNINKPLVFTWTPKNGNTGGSTCLVRMNITHNDGSRSVVSAKVGLR
jgi:M6 family metalloprotease-like protein